MACPSSQQVWVRNRSQVSTSTQDLLHNFQTSPDNWFYYKKTICLLRCKCMLLHEDWREKNNLKKKYSSAVNQQGQTHWWCYFNAHMWITGQVTKVKAPDEVLEHKDKSYQIHLFPKAQGKYYILSSQSSNIILPCPTKACNRPLTKCIKNKIRDWTIFPDTIFISAPPLFSLWFKNKVTQITRLFVLAFLLKVL